MPKEYECPSCGAEIPAPEGAAGRLRRTKRRIAIAHAGAAVETAPPPGRTARMYGGSMLAVGALLYLILLAQAGAPLEAVMALIAPVLIGLGALFLAVGIHVAGQARIADRLGEIASILREK